MSNQGVSQAVATLDTLLALYQRQNPLKSIELLKELSSGRSEDMYLRQCMAIAYAQNGMTKEAIAEYDALGEMQLEKGLRGLTAETAFVVRTFFFVIFGASIILSSLVSLEVFKVSIALILSIFLIRFILLKIFIGRNISPQLWIAPRGLITIFVDSS